MQKQITRIFFTSVFLFAAVMLFHVTGAKAEEIPVEDAVVEEITVQESSDVIEADTVEVTDEIIPDGEAVTTKAEQEDDVDTLTEPTEETEIIENQDLSVEDEILETAETESSEEGLAADVDSTEAITTAESAISTQEAVKQTTSLVDAKVVQVQQTTVQEKNTTAKTDVVTNPVTYQLKKSSDGKTTYAYDSTGKLVKNQIVNVSGKSYYADGAGKIVVYRLLDIGGVKYFAHDTGAFVINDFMNVVEGKVTNRYYFGADGKAAHNGIFTINSGKHAGSYYANTKTSIIPVMQLLNINGEKYYAHEKGKLVKNDFMNVVEGKTTNRYYFGSDGKAVHNGVFTIKSGKHAGSYYANPSNAVVPVMKLLNVSGEKYYAHEKGKIVQNDFMNVTEGKVTNRYYFGSNGKAVHNGIFTINSGKHAGTYYADPKTAIVPVMKLLTLGDEKYYAHEKGKFVKNDFMNVVEGKATNRYYFGSNGKAVHNGIFKLYSGKHAGTYYADPKTAVVPVMKLLTINGDKYYAHEKGKFVINDFMNLTENGKARRYYFGSDGKGVIVSVMAGAKGIDVSFFNGTIDWKKVAADGIKFVFVRAGGRYMATGKIYYDDHSANNNNSVFRQNVSGALANGLQVGAYFYTQAVNETEAIEEADFLYQQVKAYGSKVSLPLIIDTEYGGRHDDISVYTRTNVVKAFCERIKQHGYNPGIYASKSWLENKLDMSRLSSYPVWVAQYPHDNSYSTVTFDQIKGEKSKYQGSYFCWQFSAKGSVDGVRGKVDVNVWH